MALVMINTPCAAADRRRTIRNTLMLIVLGAVGLAAVLAAQIAVDRLTPADSNSLATAAGEALPTVLQRA
jgi:hypothetical protein